MRTNKAYELAKKEAERIVTLTVEEAERLPGLLGRSVAAHLRYNGWRALTLDGAKTLYVRKQ